MLKRNLLTNKYTSITLIVVLLCFLLCSCKAPLEKTRVFETVTFTDALNRKVSVVKKPQRVAALIGSFAEVWQLAGGEVCATSDDAFEDLGLSSDNCVNIGGAHSPNAEMLLSATPDFVIASASTSSNVKIMETLKNAGITVAYFDVDCFDDYLKMLKICTDITGRYDLYEKNGIKIKDEIESIKTTFNHHNIPVEKRRVLMLRASSGFVKAKGSEGTILGEMLNDLGCINVADTNESMPDFLSVEAVISENPYRIFVVTMGDDEKAIESLEKMFEENPAWRTLEAIKENRLHIMESELFNNKPNSDWAESYEKLTEILLKK